MSEAVEVGTLPPCDLCAGAGVETEARYDAKTRRGPWGYLCEAHWRTMTDQRLGTGLGQRLVLRGETP